MRLNLIILVIGIIGSGVALAQEVRHIDLPDVNDGVPHGSRSENFGCGGSRKLFAHQARMSLEWIETDDIYPRQRMAMKVRVENIGRAPIELPIHPNLTDLQPTESAARFEYYSLKLPLEARVADGGVLVGWLELYATPTRPDTFLTLKTGEWIRVRGDIVVRHWYATDQVATVSTDFWLTKYVFPAEENNVTTPSHQRCILPVAGTSLIARLHGESPQQ
jgi:hypothetical protein